MSVKRQSSRRLNLESLESRQLMAGNVSAFTDGNTLIIREALGSSGGAQNVFVKEFGNRLELSSFTTPASQTGSLINGQKTAVFFFQNKAVFKIDANLGGGQDTFGLTGNGSTVLRDLSIVTTNSSSRGNDGDQVSINNLKNVGSVFIDTGAGQDFLDITNSILGGAPNKSVVVNTGVLSAVGDSDRDELRILGVDTRSLLTINTGASADSFVIKNAKIGSQVSDTLLIDTGKGSDTVIIGPSASEVGAVEAKGAVVLITGKDLDTEPDNDQVHVRGLIALSFDGKTGSVFMEIGSGNDTLDMVQSEARNFSLKGMKGNDTIRLNEVTARENFFADMGENDDLLDLTFVKANTMTLDGGAGFDNLERHLMPFIPSVTIRNWELLNGKPIVKKISTTPQR